MKINPRAVKAGRNILAVEMGGDWFKLLHVTRTAAGPKVSRLVLKPVGDMAGLSGSAFRKACSLDALQGMPVVACIPRQMVNVRLFDLPSGDPQEIADMIDLQIARQTPYSREEIVHDYRLMGAERAGYTRVMLVIAQLAPVRQKVRQLEDLGFDVVAVATGTDGWLAAMQAQSSTGTAGNGQIAYLDLDSTYGDLLVLQSGVPLFSRTIPVGARELMAEPQKQEERLVQELSRALETFRNENPTSEVSQLVIAGAGAWMPGLPGRLQGSLKMAVCTSPIPATTDGIDDVSILRNVSITGLVGVAMAPERLQIDLIPESASLRKSLTVRAKQAALAATLIIATLGLASLWIESSMQRREVYLDELNRLIKDTGKAAEEVDAMRRKVGLVASRLENVMAPAVMLAELHSAVGNHIVLLSVEISRGDQMICRGTADAGEDVNQFVKVLEESALFKNVKITQTRKNKEGTEFEVACDLEKRQT